ncbi:uncharacterized protein AB675_1195 [Cyphellophora attinorum]|uniref:3-beta hydroxysteroid dehydrogenase/isomerase domain-containing protein n=1 Tax=Cyphellophora attinorum TaxID=1664694 RepID=A0A0N1P001_9EURO|nr:uncharacterized protein AB675_1195 [Phialophora attinorum]KPI38225.1 hypothetical protein AB675_1195 [Phialophora attinorum]
MDDNVRYTIYGVLIVLAHVIWWLWRLNRTLKATPDSLKKFVTPWEPEKIREAYKNVRSAEEASRPHLRSKKGRRYVIVGGSGTVGSWIVQHLLWRGEDPQAIRILDIVAPTRPEATDLNFIKTDVADDESVEAAYNAAWPERVRNQPLTVFHCAAKIYVADASLRYLDKYVPVNVDGVRFSMEAAKKTGCDCFIATSSSSVSLLSTNWWSIAGPTNYIQLRPNSEPLLELDSDEFSNCYQYTKVLMEDLVSKANEEGFRTGIIRPGHAIYGHGTNNDNSVTWRNLRMKGGITWLKPCVMNFVHCINVSLGQLALEDRLLVDPKVSGKGYAITERPELYHNYYRVLETLGGCTFPDVQPLMMLSLAQMIEMYEWVRSYLPLPAITGDLHNLQPGMLKMCMLHVLFDSKAAAKDLGYQPAFDTLEGLCMTVKDWNEKESSKNGSIDSKSNLF